MTRHPSIQKSMCNRVKKLFFAWWLGKKKTYLTNCQQFVFYRYAYASCINAFLNTVKMHSWIHLSINVIIAFHIFTDISKKGNTVWFWMLHTFWIWCQMPNGLVFWLQYIKMLRKQIWFIKLPWYLGIRISDPCLELFVTRMLI